MMNKRESAGSILRWILLSSFVMITACGFLSPDLCDRLLISVGTFGLLWLFFGNPHSLKIKADGYISFLFLTLLLLLFWIILRGIGLCNCGIPA